MITNLDTTHDIAFNVRKIMNDKGLKQKKVAEKAGYSQQAFSNFLNGRRVISSMDILNIATALDVTPNDLYGIIV